MMQKPNELKLKKLQDEAALIKLQEKIPYLKTKIDWLDQVIKKGHVSITDNLIRKNKTDIEIFGREIAKAFSFGYNYANNRLDIINETKKDLTILRQLSNNAGVENTKAIKKEIDTLTKDLEKRIQILFEQYVFLVYGIVKLNIQHFNQNLESINKPINEDNAQLYLKNAEDLLKMSQTLKIENIIKKYPAIAERFTVDEHTKFFEQESLELLTTKDIKKITKEVTKKYLQIAIRFLVDNQNQELPPTDAGFNYTKELLNELNNILKIHGDNDDILGKCLEFLYTQLNTEQRYYISQQIKLLMIEFCHKIEKIYEIPQTQYVESFLQNEIQELAYEPLPFFINVKNILDKPIFDLAVNPKILQEIDFNIRVAEVLLQNTQKLHDIASRKSNNQKIIRKIGNDIKLIDEKRTALKSKRQEIAMCVLVRKYNLVFVEDYRQEQDQNAKETLAKFSYDYVYATRTPESFLDFIKSKLNIGGPNNLPQGIKIKLLMLAKSIKRITGQDFLDLPPEPKPTNQREPISFFDPQNSLNPQRELATQKTIAIEKYANAQAALSNQVNNYLEQRRINSDDYIEKRCIPVKLSIAFGACTLADKTAAATNLISAINGVITIEDLEKNKNHHKALSQGNLGKLYKELKPKLLAMGDIKKVINGEIDLATFETKHKKALAKEDFASFYREIKPNLSNMLITEKNIGSLIQYLDDISPKF
jgi:hypothetical protein